ncbi:MAG: hypothetical protein ACRDTJ_11430, partial [Pseudonocardiaceae bacterium]
MTSGLPVVVCLVLLYAAVLCYGRVSRRVRDEERAMWEREQAQRALARIQVSGRGASEPRVHSSA